MCRDSRGKDLDGENEKVERVSVGDGRKESLSDDGSQKFVCGKARQVNEQEKNKYGYFSYGLLDYF